MKAPRHVCVEAKMRIMQGWFGECDLNYKPQADTLSFRKEEINGVLSLYLVFDIIDEEGNTVGMTMPVDNFSYMTYTNKAFAYEMPVALIFNLAPPAYKEFERSIPGLYQLWKAYYAESRKEIARSLMFVLDPSEILFTEDDNILYRPGYVEGIDMFRETFKEPWSDHLMENIEKEEADLENNIVMIPSQDFVKYFKTFGLENVESSIQMDNKKKTIRIFYRRVKKQTRAAVRAAQKRGALALAAKAEKKKRMEEELEAIAQSNKNVESEKEKKEIEQIEKEMKRQNGESIDSDLSEEIDEHFSDDLTVPSPTTNSLLQNDMQSGIPLSEDISDTQTEEKKIDKKAKKTSKKGKSNVKK